MEHSEEQLRYQVRAIHRDYVRLKLRTEPLKNLIFLKIFDMIFIENEIHQAYTANLTWLTKRLLTLFKQVRTLQIYAPRYNRYDEILSNWMEYQPNAERGI